jgi:site-specific DNA-methyltransferase (adenine-specific)
MADYTASFCATIAGMPTLLWNNKQTPGDPTPAEFRLDSILPPNAPRTGRLLLGDNLSTLAALLPEYENRLDLIYADPPFFTNRKFTARIGRNEDSRKPAEWQLAEGYHDAWTSLDDYLQFLYLRLRLMHRLLAPHGTLYLHLDWHADAYARLILDEIFGAENLINEIIWAYHGPSPIRTAFNRKHDTILMYAKSPNYIFNVDDVRVPYDPTTLKTFASSPKAGFGKVPNLARGKVPEDWWYFPVVARLHNERTGYPTQKPAALLERIIRASSNPGGIVADFFSGSGTTALVAAQNGRGFLAADATPRAILTTRQRLALNGFGATLEVNPRAAWTIQPGEARFFALNADTVTLSNSAPQLDAWEIDPAWDGQVFHSHAQAFRTRKGALEQVLALPQTKTGRRVCVRYLSVAGEMYQVQLPG